MNRYTEIPLGNITAAIWANKTKDGRVWFNVTVTRRYKDGDQWKDTSTFRRDELPIARQGRWTWPTPGSGGKKCQPTRTRLSSNG